MLNSGQLYALIFLVLILSLVAQLAVKRKFQQYSQVYVESGLTGGQVARRILEDAGITNVRIERADGYLSDHYDPHNMVLRLSSATMDQPSVAAVGVAAHEAGHVLQHKDAYAPLVLRTACVKSASIGSQAAWPLFLLGIILSWEPLLWIGIGLYAAMVAFTLITLPVELNASSRALSILSANQYLAPGELPGARKVLSAAALTYVASALMAVLQLLRLITIANRNRR